MSQWEHERKDDYLAAMRELHRQVAEDIAAKRGFIKPAVVKWAYYDSKIVLMKARVLQWIKSA